MVMQHAVLAVVAVISALAAPPVQPRERAGEEASDQTRIAVVNVGVPSGDVGDEDLAGGAIGHVVLASDIRGALPALEAAGVEVLVLRINAGMEFRGDGGYRAGTGAEVERFVELIVNELNPRFRTVAWIESAVDTAAVAAWACEELCFFTTGNLGAAVLEAGPGQAAKGEELAAWQRLGERASAASGRDAAIMRSMQGMVPLSVTVGPDGMRAWSNDLKGEKVVNEENRVLALNAFQAERLGISVGRAGTRESLAERLGIGSPVWVAEEAATEVDRAQRSRAANGD